MTLSASADELSYAEHVRISDDTQVHVAKLILKTCFLHGRVPSPLFAVGGEIIFCVCVCVFCCHWLFKWQNVLFTNISQAYKDFKPHKSVGSTVSHFIH